MSKWGKCEAEGRDHGLMDFKSQAIWSRDGKLVGHAEVCRYCGKRVTELMK